MFFTRQLQLLVILAVAGTAGVLALGAAAPWEPRVRARSPEPAPLEPTQAGCPPGDPSAPREAPCALPEPAPPPPPGPAPQPPDGAPRPPGPPGEPPGGGPPDASPGPSAEPAMPVPPTPPDPAPPAPPRIVRATVTSVEGAISVDVGSLCAFPVDSRERPDGAQWCNAQIVCGGELLYGGPSGGDFPCELLDAPRPGVRGEDDATHAADQDAALRLDTEAEALEVWDDETGDHGAFRVVATVEAVDVLPAASLRDASPREGPAHSP